MTGLAGGTPSQQLGIASTVALSVVLTTAERSFLDCPEKDCDANFVVQGFSLDQLVQIIRYVDDLLAVSQTFCPEWLLQLYWLIHLC